MPPIRNGKRKVKKPKARVQPYAKVSNPISVGCVQKATQPKVVANAKSCRIKHRELLDLIDMSAGFEARSYRINPGVASTFPWLSGQSQGWEQYRFHSLALRYLPTCATTEPGVMVMFVDYDPTDSPPTTIRDGMTNSTATAGPVRNAATIITNTAGLLGGLKSKYVETQMSAQSDARSTDSGNFFILTEGGNNVQVGAVWVEYDVELLYPQRATPSAYSHAIGNDATATSVNIFGVPAGGQLTTVGHLIHNIVGKYPDGTPTSLASDASKQVALKNLLAGARYLVNAYANTTGSAAPTQLTGALSLDGVGQTVEPLVSPSLSGTGFKNVSFVWRAPEWLTSASRVIVGLLDSGTVMPDSARISVERIPETAIPFAYI